MCRRRDVNGRGWMYGEVGGEYGRMHGGDGRVLFRDVRVCGGERNVTQNRGGRGGEVEGCVDDVVGVGERAIGERGVGGEF